MLGTASPAAGRRREDVTSRSGKVSRTCTTITTLQLLHHTDQRITAYAFDSPRVGETLPGAGFELNGWAIGALVAVAAIRVAVSDSPSCVVPLDVIRPDVAADYPSVPHAAASGFSTWITVSEAQEPSEFEVVALLADGEEVRLASIVAAQSTKEISVEAGMRGINKPDFVIIGTQRGGTTSLHAYLSAHPNVRTPAKKELHFFTDRFARGLAWYQGQFPRQVPAGTIVGEATPYALFHPASPQRLLALAPEARLIALLRNPVDRAYSHYLLERSRGHEPLSFAEAIAAEPERLSGLQDRLATDANFASASHKRFSYLSRGLYAAQLERWRAVVPREQMLVLPSESLYRHPEHVMDQVARFLGIRPDTTSEFAVHNSTAGPPLDATLRKHLVDYFSAPNARLQQLLGWDAVWGEDI